MAAASSDRNIISEKQFPSCSSLLIVSQLLLVLKKNWAANRIKELNCSTYRSKQFRNLNVIVGQTSKLGNCLAMALFRLRVLFSRYVSLDAFRGTFSWHFIMRTHTPAENKISKTIPWRILSFHNLCIHVHVQRTAIQKYFP